ncbi:MAG TPA: hypothetical protein VF171_08455 [Trueperaceae bacterium]
MRRLALCLACLWLGPALAAGAAFTNAPEARGLPGAYVTLPFTVEGRGAFTIHVLAPEGWQPLSQDRKVSLDGETTLPVTIRVPADALGGARADIRLQALAGGAAVAEAAGTIIVEGRYQLALSAPSQLEGHAETPLSFHVRVQNLGNMPDSVLLKAESGGWRTALSQGAVELAPHGSTDVEVTLYPSGRFNDGYRRMLTLSARSSHDPEVTALRQVLTIFHNGDATAARPTSANPQLELRVETGLTGKLRISDGRAESGLSYYLAPNLNGDLSDYVGVSVTPSPLSGNQDHPLNIPNSTSISLTADTWNASLYASPGSVGLGVGFEAADWRWNVGGNYAALAEAPTYGVSLGAVSLTDGLDLQFYGNAALAGAGHGEYLTGLYRTPLGEGFTLDLATTLAGIKPGPSEDYRLTPAITENLRYGQQTFDLRQSYRVVPTLGLHTLELSGGTRSSYPVGVRASSRMEVSPEDTDWQTGVSLLSRPAPGLELGVTGSYNTTDFGAAETSWVLGPSASYTYAFAFGLQSGISLGYRHTQALTPDVATSDGYRFGLSNSYDRFSLKTSASYTLSRGPVATRELTLTTDAAYALSPRSELIASYAFTAAEDPGWSATHRIGASWEQTWTDDLASELAFRRKTLYGLSGRGEVDESLGFSLAARNLFGDGLRFRAGYTLSADAGLLEAGAHYQHDLSLSIGYVFSLPFDTPRALVDAFGGRESGRVAGRAFLDANLNGVLDPGETPLAGLEVSLGNATTTTDDQGAYELRVPAGSYTFGFPGGLPATLGLMNGKEQAVELNESYQHNLAFAPVTTLAVSLFDDANHNGARDQGEAGIPYGGILIDGPIDRRVQTDSQGQAYVAGLVEGSYEIRADPDLLPAHYQPTKTVELSLDPSAQTAPLAIGAAIPKRKVVTTFRTGSLGLLASVDTNSRPAGAELLVRARVQGQAQEVVVEMFGQRVPLDPHGLAWEATLRIPPDTTPGLVQGIVRASGQGAMVERSIQVLVTDDPPYRLGSVRGTANESADLELTTFFQATRATLVLPGAQAVDLTSEDGYAWRGTLRLPPEAGELLARLVIDGIEVQEVKISVEPPERAAGLP